MRGTFCDAEARSGACGCLGQRRFPLACGFGMALAPTSGLVQRRAMLINRAAYFSCVLLVLTVILEVALSSPA